MKNDLMYFKVMDLIKKVNQTKQLVKDFYILSENVSSLDESSDYLYECELQMNYCTKLQNKIFDLIEEYNLNIDYIGFDSALIWSYFE